jgi:hypothetical protein
MNDDRTQEVENYLNSIFSGNNSTIASEPYSSEPYSFLVNIIYTEPADTRENTIEHWLSDMNFCEKLLMDFSFDLEALTRELSEKTAVDHKYLAMLKFAASLKNNLNLNSETEIDKFIATIQQQLFAQLQTLEANIKLNQKIEPFMSAESINLGIFLINSKLSTLNQVPNQTKIAGLRHRLNSLITYLSMASGSLELNEPDDIEMKDNPRNEVSGSLVHALQSRTQTSQTNSLAFGSSYSPFWLSEDEPSHAPRRFHNEMYPSDVYNSWDQPGHLFGDYMAGGEFGTPSQPDPDFNFQDNFLTDSEGFSLDEIEASLRESMQEENQPGEFDDMPKLV